MLLVITAILLIATTILLITTTVLLITATILLLRILVATLTVVWPHGLLAIRRDRQQGWALLAMMVSPTTSPLILLVLSITLAVHLQCPLPLLVLQSMQ